MRAFVIAMECEADAVRPSLRPDDRLYVSGIGKVNATAATQRAICEGAAEIWNAGLCGGFASLIAQTVPNYADKNIWAFIYQILTLINTSMMTFLTAYRLTRKNR